MRDDVVTLVGAIKYKDKNGVWKTKEQERVVFCKVDSVSMTEFFEGGKAGLRPEKRFLIFPGDYAGEQEVEHRGQRFAVYRVYERNNDVLEVYVQRKSGVA